MTATINIDSAGRIALPEPLQRIFGVEPGERVQAEGTLDRIEILRKVPVASATMLSASRRLVLAHTTIVPNVALAMRQERDELGNRAAGR